MKNDNLKSLLKSKLNEELPRGFDEKFWDGHKKERKIRAAFLIPTFVMSLFISIFAFNLMLTPKISLTEDEYISYLDELIELEDSRFVSVGLEEEDDLSYSERPSL